MLGETSPLVCPWYFFSQIFKQVYFAGAEVFCNNLKLHAEALRGVHMNLYTLLCSSVETILTYLANGKGIAAQASKFLS